VRWGVLVVNPAALVEMPRRRAPEMQALEAEQVRSLRSALATSPHAVLFDFMLGTGCRPGEALGLRWQDFDLERGVAVISQTLTNDE
jgi:integrase